VDSRAEYSAFSSTCSQKIHKKKKLKQTNASAPLIQYRLRSVNGKSSPDGIRVTMEERICERESF